MKPLVVYHKRCADGVASAALLAKYFPEPLEMLPGIYQKPPADMDFFNGRDVFFVDFSYEFSFMEEILQRARSVIYLDHHAAAVTRMRAYAHMNKLDMSFSVSDESLSGVGCVWAWLEVNGLVEYDERQPAILKYIQDRDLWKFEYGDLSRYVNEYLQYRGITIANLHDLLSYTEEDLAAKVMPIGEVLRTKFINDCQSIIAQGRRFEDFRGHRIALVNANGQYASEVGNMLCLDKEHPVDFAATYFEAQGTINYSLRSLKGGPDVSKIAAIWGGGGHANAAGFKTAVPAKTLELMATFKEKLDEFHDGLIK
jgi:oligoribonuclease NrnB/cAMP/cGMP phosphodiesterase (DHH superfamily)